MDPPKFLPFLLCLSVLRSFFVFSLPPSISVFLVRSCIHSFIRLFVHSFVRSFVHSFVRSFVRSFIRLFVRSFVRSFALSSFNYSCVYCCYSSYVGSSYCGDDRRRTTSRLLFILNAVSLSPILPTIPAIMPRHAWL